MFSILSLYLSWDLICLCYSSTSVPSYAHCGLVLGAIAVVVGMAGMTGLDGRGGTAPGRCHVLRVRNLLHIIPLHIGHVVLKLRTAFVLVHDGPLLLTDYDLAAGQGLNEFGGPFSAPEKREESVWIDEKQK